MRRIAAEEIKIPDRARFEAYADRLGLSVADTAAFCCAADTCWSIIANDCLEEGAEMHQMDVIEIVNDQFDQVASGLPPAALVLWKSHNHSDTMKKLLKDFVFIYKWYGV